MREALAARVSLAHFQVASQHRVVKVEVHRLEGCAGRSSNDHIIVEALVQGQLVEINESDRIDNPRLQVLENRVLSGNAEHHLVQVRQPFRENLARAGGYATDKFANRQS
jgi:hypothetical protein